PHVPALDRDLSIRLVRGQRHVRSSERPILEQHEQPVKAVATAKLRFVQLRVDVMVVEDELLAEDLEERTDQKKQVGRIAGVDDVEASSQQNLPRQEECREQRNAVFE